MVSNLQKANYLWTGSNFTVMYIVLAAIICCTCNLWLPMTLVKRVVLMSSLFSLKQWHKAQRVFYLVKSLNKPGDFVRFKSTTFMLHVNKFFRYVGNWCEALHSKYLFYSFQYTFQCQNRTCLLSAMIWTNNIQTILCGKCYYKYAGFFQKILKIVHGL